jgi:uncharacterized protein YndB with AHSA1/START domain
MPNILHQFQVEAPIEKVFDAFALPAGLDSWWTLQSSGTPKLHEEYRFYFGPEYDWRAEVIHVVPGRELTWQMTRAMDDWLPTQVGFKLTEREQNCTVHFFHSNWADSTEHFAHSTFCWGQLLKGLKDFVEHGKVIPFDRRN